MTTKESIGADTESYCCRLIAAIERYSEGQTDISSVLHILAVKPANVNLCELFLRVTSNFLDVYAYAVLLQDGIFNSILDRLKSSSGIDSEFLSHLGDKDIQAKESIEKQRRCNQACLVLGRVSRCRGFGDMGFVGRAALLQEILFSVQQIGEQKISREIDRILHFECRESFMDTVEQNLIGPAGTHNDVETDSKVLAECRRILSRAEQYSNNADGLRQNVRELYVRYAGSVAGDVELQNKEISMAAK